MSANNKPSLDLWLKEIKEEVYGEAGSVLVHSGIVRRTPREKVRHKIERGLEVVGMEFAFDAAKVEEVVAVARELPGVFSVRVWLNEGQLMVGEEIMLVIVAADIRPNALSALSFLLDRLKGECVNEREILSAR